MNNKELLHHLECLHYKIKYNIPMVDTESKFMTEVLKDIIEKIKDEIK